MTQRELTIVLAERGSPISTASLSRMEKDQQAVPQRLLDLLAEVLATGEDLRRRWEAEQDAARGRARRVMTVPPPPVLVGRDAEIGEVDAAWQAAVGARRPALLLVHGPAGVGTSALARAWAHRVQDQFAAAVHVDLRDGRDPVAEVLGQLGVPVPIEPPERMRLWRSVAARAPLLVVAEHVAATGQHRLVELLAGTAGGAVVVTSRSALGAVGAQLHRISVGPLDARQGLNLLAALIGPSRVTAEVVAAQHLVHRSGGFPEKLITLAAGLADDPGRSLIGDLAPAPLAAVGVA